MAKPLREWIDNEVAELRKIPKQEFFEQTFFRDPFRPFFIDSNHFFSPADGTILYAKQVKNDERILDVKGQLYTLSDLMQDDKVKEAVIVGIFMSMWDVHINRVPFPGMLKYKKLEKITTKNKPMFHVEHDIEEVLFDRIKNDMGYVFENERVLNLVYAPKVNYKYYMVQIADSEVDVIGHFYRQGKYFNQNERFSIVRYGSQCDLVLPMPMPFKYEIMVSEGMHVEAGVDRLIKIG